jgi:hypothetical protein
VPNLFTHFVCLQFCTYVLQWRQLVNNSMKQHYWFDGFSLTLPPYTHVYLVIHILIKLLDLSNAFLVEYLLTAMPDISTSLCCYTIEWLCKLQKGCTRLAATSDKVYQLLVIYVWQDIHVYMGEVSMRNHHINNVASYCCCLLACTAKQMYKIVNKQSV